MTDKSPKETKFNPSLGTAVADNRFGEGSIITFDLTAENLGTVVKNLQVGSKFLFRKKNRPTSDGRDQYFIEILPPFTGKKEASKTKKASSNDASELG